LHIVRDNPPLATARNLFYCAVHDAALRLRVPSRHHPETSVSLPNRTELLQQLIDIGIALAGERDVATLTASIVDHARRLTRAHGGLLLLREDDRLRPAAAHEAAEPPDIAGEVAATGRIVNHGSTLAVPLLERSGGLLGVLVLTDATDEKGRAIPFDPDHETLVASLAAYAAAALHNARVYGAAIRHADKLTALSRLTGVMTSAHDAQEVFHAIADAATTLLGAVWTRVWANDPDERVVRAQASYGIDATIDTIMMDMPVLAYGEGLVGRIAETAAPEYVRDVASDPRFLDRRLVGAGLVHGFVGLPLVTASGIGGVLAILFRDRRDFPPEDRQLMELLAGHAAVALENAELSRRTATRLRETETLLSVSRALSSTLNLQDLLRHFLRRVAHAVDADTVGSYMLDATGEWLTPLQGYRLPAEHLDALRRLRLSIHQYPFYVEGARTKRPIFSRRAADDPRIPPIVHAELPHRSQLFVPIVSKDRVIGGLIAVWWLRERDFSDSDLGLIEAIATQAGVALENARLFQENSRQLKELSAAQDQLLRTEKLRALGEMASGVAHDFNNVLAAILGRAQLLIGELRDPRLREWAEIIDRAAQDGAQTVRRLQEFTRIRRDHPVVAVDLNDVVRGALEMTQSRWRDEPASRDVAIELRTSLAPVPPISGDPAELREALTNLILNAVDAMPHGGVLTLATRASGAGVEVTVADTGVGMSESVKEKIFDPFFTTKGPRGTGLGLSMTYGILVRHDAKVAVESAMGRGSTFHLTFAAVLPDAEAVPTPVTTAPTPATSLHCLVIDDEEAVGGILRDILASAGHTTVVFTDPAAAILRATTEHFDVVFTDLAMPGLPGWDVARSIKAASPDSAVLLMTGYGVELSREEQERYGVDAVLAKPAGVATILEAVARVAPRRDPPRRG
jgi:signal transduction histidine kinase/CheY-like chemotaxis protein